MNAASVAGIAAYVIFLATYYVFGANPFAGMQWVATLVGLVIMYYTLKRFRDTELEGFATYGQLLSPSWMYAFVFASMSGMLIYAHAWLVDDSFVEVVRISNLQDLGEAKDVMISLLGEEAYKLAVEELQKLDVTDIALSDFQMKFFLSFLTAFILAAVIKRKPPVTEV